MPRILLPTKTPGESVLQAFDFASYIPVGATLASAVTTCSVYRGTDPSPSSVISGTSAVSGTKASQTLAAGLDGVIYLVTCLGTLSNGEVISLQGFLAVLALIP